MMRNIHARPRESSAWRGFSSAGREGGSLYSRLLCAIGGCILCGVDFSLRRCFKRASGIRWRTDREVFNGSSARGGKEVAGCGGCLESFGAWGWENDEGVGRKELLSYSC